MLAICGVVFALPSASLVCYGVRNGPGGLGATHRGTSEDDFTVVGWLLGLVMVAGMATVASWIAPRSRMIPRMADWHATATGSQRVRLRPAVECSSDVEGTCGAILALRERPDLLCALVS